MGAREDGASEEAALPEGWSWATLGELSYSVKNGIFVSRPSVEPDGVPVLRIGAVRPLDLRLSDLRYTGLAEEEVLALDGVAGPGDLLFTRYNGNPNFVGVCARVPDDAPLLTYPDKLIRARVPSDLVDSRYVAYAWAWQATVRRLRQHLKTTAGQTGISGNSLKSISVPFAPLLEQHRIADALDERLARLAEIESRLMAAQQHLEKLRDFVMTAAATGVLAWDADLQDMPLVSSPSVKDGTLPPLAAGWHWSRLQDIAEVVGGVTKDSKNQHDPALPEVPYLRVANAQRARLELSQVTRIRVAPKALEKLRLRHGDLLMAEGGDRDKLGRGWIWENQIEDCIHQNHLFRARILGGATHPKLLGWYVNSAARSWFEANGKQSVNLASISISKVKLLPVPVPPADEQEQRDFVKLGEQVLARFDHLVTACGRGLAHATALRSALLAEAFAGRLVPQDPDDEPAEDLLKRIRAEREAADAERKAARRAATQAKRKSQTKRKVPAPADAPPPSAPTTDTPLPEGEQATLPLEFNA
ncbi:hypothetical protein ACFY4I_00365 [Streptomyces scabiei]|uniref:restriction endonuclease subunit S n=1 Tax=Streptomyces scabiei TaxID=1930 RepID=UPI00369D25D5